METRTLETGERILDAAERLFMAHGYEGTSMRQITSEAGVNLAAVNYHFGSKESLMQEVFRRRLDWLNEERMRVLDELEREAGGEPLKPSIIVDAFFGTLLRMAGDEKRGGITFLRLLGRTLTEPSEFIRAFLAHEYKTVMDRYKEALFRALPEVPKAEIVWRFHFMLGATSYAIAGTDALRLVTDWQIEEEDSTDRLDRLVPRLMSFLMGGLRAPLAQFENATTTETTTGPRVEH
jgi:AcrR family transcriptional regulator